MGVSHQIANMKFFALVLAFIASASCDAYTVGQVAHGATYGGIVTGVDYGHGLVSGVGAIGNRAVYAHAPAVHSYAAVPAVHHELTTARGRLRLMPTLLARLLLDSLST